MFDMETEEGLFEQDLSTHWTPIVLYVLSATQVMLDPVDVVVYPLRHTTDTVSPYLRGGFTEDVKLWLFPMVGTSSNEHWMGRQLPLVSHAPFEPHLGPDSKTWFALHWIWLEGHVCWAGVFAQVFEAAFEILGFPPHAHTTLVEPSHVGVPDDDDVWYSVLFRGNTHTH